MSLASPPARLEMSSLRFTKGMVVAIPLRHRRSPGQASERGGSEGMASVDP
jgi:hypothetical protein